MKTKYLVMMASFLLLLASAFVTLRPHAAYADIFNDIVHGVKQFIAGVVPPSISMSASIALAPGGDLNHDGKIEAGDTILYSYTINNPTQTSYQFSTLKTAIDTKILNSFGTVKGASSLDTSNNTIAVPNISLQAMQQKTISFTARVNFYDDQDQTLSTIPTLVGNDGSTIVTGVAQNTTAGKLSESDYDTFVHITSNTNTNKQ